MKCCSLKWVWWREERRGGDDDETLIPQGDTNLFAYIQMSLPNTKINIININRLKSRCQGILLYLLVIPLKVQYGVVREMQL